MYYVGGGGFEKVSFRYYAKKQKGKKKKKEKMITMKTIVNDKVRFIVRMSC